MLDNARREAAHSQLDALAVAIKPPHFDLAMPWHLATDVGDAEATFPVVDHLVADRGDLGVDEGDRWGRLVTTLHVERGHEEADVLVYLRRSQAHAVILIHSLHHVVDELLDSWRANRRLVERLGLLAEHRMSHAGHFQNRHISRIILAATDQPQP